jgi:tetratricopeptide (TPR) repeat protein
LAGFQALEGARKFGSPESAPAIRRALSVLTLAERFHPSRSGSTLRLLCQIALGELGGPQPLLIGEPNSATDYYFLGLVHLAIQSRTLSDHPVTRLLLAGLVSSPSGLDFQTPLVTAEKYLREAARLEPQHYFTYLFLSRAFRMDNQPDAAELAVNTCVGLRPDYPLGYYERARVIDLQFQQSNNPQLRARLITRVIADCSEAIRLDSASIRAFRLDSASIHAFRLRGEMFRENGKNAKAIEDFSEAIRLQKKDNKGTAGTNESLSPEAKSYLNFLYNRRAYLFAQGRQWGKAAGDLGSAIELEPDDPVPWRLYAALLVRADDMDNYRKASERMLAHFAQTKNARTAACIALACSQAPLPAADTAQAVRLAQRADPSVNWHQSALGAAYYRSGQYDQSIAALKESLKIVPDSPNSTSNWPLLAMAHHQLDQDGKARECLDKGNRWYEQQRAGSPQDVFVWGTESWWDGVEFENLQGEAKALLQQAKR